MRKRLFLLAGCILTLVTAFAQDEPSKKSYDTRWYISPLLKFQMQEFGMLEKNRKNHLSNAETLPILDKSNYSFAASVYKNLTGRLSVSMDVGFSKGHVTGDDVLISNTTSKTYNQVNATIYYHLISARYRLQPFIAAGINNLTNESSYTSAPVGAGVKFTGKKIMVEAQAAYGYSVSKNISNTLMYSLGIYFPMKNKKSKKKQEEEEKKSDKARDTAKKTEGNVTNITNNYYFFMAPGTDSSKLKGKDNDDDNDGQDGDKKPDQKNRSGKPSQSGNTSPAGEKPDNKNAETAPVPLDPDDPMNFPAAVKHIVYFYYDQYSLTSSAFAVVDEVIQKMKINKNLKVHLKGYTDLQGSEQYNLPLSKKRAQMVFDYMNSRGIPQERMILSHYGKENPVVNSNDPKSAWQNRRCEIVLFEKK